MKYKILVVDDDKELVKMLCSYFNMKQYETITATDGMEALNKIKMKPDIILLDINMPRMDGIEVCRLIRSKVLCPILFLTARVDEDDKINGLLSGGDDYITKPFSLRELEARIVTNIKREERHQQKTEYRFMDEMLIDYSEKIVAIALDTGWSSQKLNIRLLNSYPCIQGRCLIKNVYMHKSVDMMRKGTVER